MITILRAIKFFVCSICVSGGAVCVLNPRIASVLPIICVALALIIFLVVKTHVLITGREHYRLLLILSTLLYGVGIIMFFLSELPAIRIISLLFGLLLSLRGIRIIVRSILTYINNEMASWRRNVLKGLASIMLGVAIAVYPLEITLIMGLLISLAFIALGFIGFLLPQTKKDQESIF